MNGSHGSFDIADELVAAVREYGKAMRRVEQARVERDATLDDLERLWQRRLEDTVSRIDESAFDPDEDDLWEILTSFWRQGQDERLSEWPDLAQAAEEELAGLSHRIRAANAATAQAEQHASVPHHRFAQALHAWHSGVVAGTEQAVPTWGRLLREWRDALALPMRVAGDILGVSAAAIARWEKNSDDGDGRAPSASRLATAVAAMASAGPASTDTDYQGAIRQLERSSFVLPGNRSLADTVRKGADDTALGLAEQVDRLAMAAELLTPPQVEALATLASRPDALDALTAWADGRAVHPLATTFEALAARSDDR